MSLFPNMQTFLLIGPFRIQWYAVCILTGIALVYLLSQSTLKKWSYEPDLLENLLTPLLICGIVGARLYYVIFNFGVYQDDLVSIFYVWQGGLAIYGGLLAGSAYAVWYFRRRSISVLRMADAIIPNILLGQAIGRWGNFMNQEAFGSPVSAQFYAGWPKWLADHMWIDGAYRMPTFLFESVGNLIGFCLIVFWLRKKVVSKHGDAASLYLIWYGLVRFVVEGLRTDSLMMGPLRVSQVLSAILVVVGLAWLLLKRRSRPVILFDLDGTLVDSQALVFETFKRVFEAHGKKLKPEEYYSFWGPTLEESFSLHFPKEQVDQLVKEYQQLNWELHETYLKPFAHAKEVLESLSKDYTLGIVSNKRVRVVKKGLELTGLSPYFQVVLGFEDLVQPKPSAFGLLLACEKLHTSRDQVIYVGDNVTDVLAAKKMAAYSIVHLSDPNQKERIEKVKPNRIITDLRSLNTIVKEARSWNDNTIW